MKLKGKKAIITGGSEGFGKAVALFFLKEGAQVMICARNAEMLFKTRDELSIFGNIQAQCCNIASPSDVEQLIHSTYETFGGIDILVSNAAIHGPKGSFEQDNWDDWSDTIDINLKGSALLCHKTIPYFKKQKSGKIILLSGGGATKSMPYFSAYAASKAGLVRLGETLADELKDFNINVNMVAPGAMNTRLLDDVLAAGPEKVGEKYYQQVLEQQRTGGTLLEKGAALCVFLASDESKGITGKLISAVWDPWDSLPEHVNDLNNSDIYTLRRIIPSERGKTWGEVV